MNLGENLIKYRKNNGLSQDDLAGKLNVSRQSIYKWESGQSYPEVERLIQISELLNCSLDDLVKNEVSGNNHGELKEKYTKVYKRFGIAIGSGVALILMGVVSLLLLMDLLGRNHALPVIIMFSFVIIAVFLFIFFGVDFDQFISEYKDYIQGPLFTKKEKKSFRRRFGFMIAFAVIFILLSVIVVIAAYGFSDNNSLWPAAIMLTMIAISVFILIYYGIMDELHQQTIVKER